MALFRQNKSGITETGVGYKIDLKNVVDHRYHLEVTGLLMGQFTSLKGGEMEIAVVKHDVVFETGDSTTLMIPGTTSFAPIILSRGFGHNQELFDWFAQASSGDIVQARRNGSIMLKDYVNGSYETVVQWNFTGAWPIKIGGFGSNQYTGSKYASLSLTIVVESIERVEP